MAQKTPISLMNELCKANSVSPEYKVVEETGPPHQKSFRVELNIENVGSYEGIGQTIKSAKHKAAQLGLETSGLTKPERTPKSTNLLAPSVELNSFAMKLGKMIQYLDLPYGPNQHSGPTPLPSNAYSQYGGQHKQYSPGSGFPSYGHSPTKLIKVCLKVGEKEYFGEGYRRKDARHIAAVEALKDLRKEYNMEAKAGKHDTSEIPLQESVNGMNAEPSTEHQVQAAEQNLPVVAQIKSEISQVYEIASKQKFKIDFEVVSSTGPPHNRTFVTSVTVGEFTAVGEGPSKKSSKQVASIKILEELKKLPPLVVVPSSRPKGRLFNHGGYGKKTQKELDSSLNPISLLGQLRQRRKEMLPVYTLVAEEGIRNKEFTMQVQVDSHTARGSGANKKEAKKSAAEAMLQLLGIRSSTPVIASQGDSGKSEVQDKNEKQNQADEKSVDKENASEGRQLPPGLLPILPEMTTRNIPHPAAQAKPLTNHTQQTCLTVTVLNRAPGAPVGKPMSEEILQNGSTPSIKKLQQLAESGGFQVQYQDTTQENNEQCLAMVSMTTAPPLISRGFGPTLDLAFENAAANALVHLCQTHVPQNGPVIDHHNENAPGQRNLHMSSSEEPAGGKSMV